MFQFSQCYNMVQKYGDCILHLPTTSTRSRSHIDTRQSTTSNQLSPLEPPTRLINNYNNFTSIELRCLIINCHTFLRSRWTRMHCTGKQVYLAKATLSYYAQYVLCSRSSHSQLLQTILCPQPPKKR